MFSAGAMIKASLASEEKLQKLAGTVTWIASNHAFRSPSIKFKIPDGFRVEVKQNVSGQRASGFTFCLTGLDRSTGETVCLDLLDTLALRELTDRRSEITDRLYLSISRQVGAHPFLSGLGVFEKQSPGWYHFELVTKAVALGLAGLRSIEDDTVQLSVAALLTLLMALILYSSPLIKHEQAAASMVTYTSCFFLLLSALICKASFSQNASTWLELVFFILSMGLYAAPAVQVFLDLKMLMNRSQKYMNPDVSLDEFIEDFAFRLTPKEDRQWMSLRGDADGVISPTCPQFGWSLSTSESFIQKCFWCFRRCLGTGHNQWSYEHHRGRIITMTTGDLVLPLFGGGSGDCVKVRAFVNSDREQDLWLPAASLTKASASQEDFESAIEMAEQS
eukprot:TRINITY_DN13401_c0_g1_i1.p1 TRINITY_DN13401_c0_g1~~TRINITY_DN13401_c0_g1_i1.p1  ORF type:complete len:439 (-),score=83.38 TRINITY_DN13401_c0_g1_i1:78-1250(-)